MNVNPVTDAGPKPVPLRVSPDNIPQEVKALPQWVVWRYEFIKGKWIKPPFRADSGFNASSTNPATWADFNTALASYQKSGWDGIGFALTREQQIIGIDLDHCIDENKAIAPWAQTIIKGLNSYTEVSPSGTGVHIYLKGEKKGGGRKHGNIEVYPEGRYLTFTGRVLKACTVRTIEPRKTELDAFLAEHFPEPKTENRAGAASNCNGHLSDHEVIELALGAKNGAKVRTLLNGDHDGYPSASEADMALCSLLAFYTQDQTQIDRLYRGSRLFRDKWDEKHYGDGATYGERTIRKAIAGATETYSGKAEGDKSQKWPQGASQVEKIIEEEADAKDLEPAGVAVRNFPEAAWTGLFRRWRDIAAPCTEAPVESLWGAFLVAAGLILGRNVWRSSPRPLYPNFYLLLVGQTGDSRKSTVLWLAEELLQRVGGDVAIIKGIVSTEGLLEALAAKEETRALGYADEFRSLLAVARRKGTQDILPRLQSLHSCPSQDTVTRKEKSTTAVKPFLSFITATPQAFVDDLLGELEITGGFLNRFLIITGEVQNPKPMVKPPSEVAWDSVVRPLREIAKRVAENACHAEFNPEAEQLWIEFYTQWRTKRKTCNPRTADLSARTFEHVLKMAVVYSVLAGEQAVTPRSLATAIAIGEWLEGTTLALFGDTGLDRRTKAQNAILERLRKAKERHMYVRDLQRNLSVKVTGSDFRDALRVLGDNDQVTVFELVTMSGQKRKVVQLVSSDTRQENLTNTREKVAGVGQDGGGSQL